jgi:hypothetical protein
LHGSFATFNPNTGANKDADLLPELIVYEEGSITALTTTNTVQKITTGRYRWQVNVETSAGFEVGKFYEVWISATVTGTDTVSQVAPVTSFRCTTLVGDDLSTQASVDVVDGIVDAIKAKTDNLPTDPADQSAVEAAITAATSPLATAANLATVSGYLDTEIQAILDDTNELQLDWADGGRLDLILDARASQTSVDDLPTNAELATALGTGTWATAIPWNAAWDAEVQSEVADALTIYGPSTQTSVDAIAIVANRIGSVVFGTVTGAGTATEVFVGAGITTTVTVDVDGNRSNVVFT